MIRALDVLLCGLARTPELLARSLLDFTRLRRSGHVGRVVFATWQGEIDKQPGLRSQLVAAGIELIEARLPNPPGPGNVWAQMRSLELGLGALDADALVLKTRADVWLHPGFIERLTDPDFLEPSADPQVRRHLRFDRRIWVPWYEITKPFYLGDEAFCGEARDLKQLVNYDARYDTVYEIDAGISHLRRFMQPFLEQHPIFSTYLEHGGRTGHASPHRFAILHMALQTKFFLGVLASYYFLLAAHHRIDSTALPNQIVFRDWSIPKAQPDPDQFLENFSIDRAWRAAAGHLFAYDERWLANVVSGALPGGVQFDFIGETIARLRAGSGADVAAWLAASVPAYRDALAHIRERTGADAPAPTGK
jgi:hypothetical protein